MLLPRARSRCDWKLISLVVTLVYFLVGGPRSESHDEGGPRGHKARTPLPPWSPFHSRLPAEPSFERHRNFCLSLLKIASVGQAQAITTVPSLSAQDALVNHTEAASYARIPGRVFAPDCGHALLPNPVHLLFGVGAALAAARNPALVVTDERGQLLQTHGQRQQHAFDTVSLLFCPHWRHFPEWQLGELFWKAAFDGWVAKGLVSDVDASRFPPLEDLIGQQRTHFKPMGHASREEGNDSAGSGPEPEAVCFDDITISRSGFLLLNPEDRTTLLSTLRRLDPLLRSTTSKFVQKSSLAERCRQNTLRIVHYLRLKNDSTDARALVFPSSITKGVFHIMTTLSSDPLSSQYLAWNDFDILVTPAGSHLALLALTDNLGEKAVVEVGAALRDGFTRGNVEKWGIGAYLYSHGHSPLDPSAREALSSCQRKEDPRYGAVASSAYYVDCPDRGIEGKDLVVSRYTATVGPVKVDGAKLTNDLAIAIGELCAEL